MGKIVRQLAPGNPDLQHRLECDYTHTQVVQAFCEKLMFAHHG